MAVTDGMGQLAEGLRTLLGAIRQEGAGPRVSAAAAALEQSLSIGPDSDMAAPIARISFYSYGDSPAQLSLLSVSELMDENGGFEDSAWFWIEQMLAEGIHDDSDLRSGVLCIYMAGEREQLREQARSWSQGNPAVVADKALDLSILERPVR